MKAYWNNMKLSSRMSIFVGVAALLVFMVVLFVILLNTHSSIRVSAIDYLEEVASGNASEVSHYLNRVKHSVDHLGNVARFEQGQGQADSRDNTIELMRAFLRDQSDILGLWTVWEPDAFDGKDSQFRGKDYHDSSGRFVPYVVRSEAGIAVEPLVGYDDPAVGQYYQGVRESKQTLVIDPYRYEVGESQYLMTTLSVPLLDSGGHVIGAVGADTDVLFLQELAESIVPLNATARIITDSGFYVANAYDSDLAGETAKDLSFSPEQQAVLRSGAVLISEGSKEWQVSAAIPIEGSPSMWALHLTVPYDSIFAHYIQLRNMLTGIVLLFVLLFIAGVYWIIRLLLRPVVEVVAVAETIADGDLRHRVSDRHLNKSETGVLARSVNTMADKLAELIGDVKISAERVHASTGAVTEATAQLKVSSLEVARAIDGIAQGATSQASDAEDGLVKVTALAEGVQQLQQQASMMRESADEIVDKNRITMTAIERLGAEAAASGEATASVQREMLRLADKFRSVAESLEAIKNVAAQTNILSLNASIEAARAGEYGRGFAVVANEIRKLANDSGQLAEHIGEMLSSMNEHTEQSMSSVAHAVESEQHLRHAVQEVDNASTDIQQITGRLALVLQETVKAIDEIGVYNQTMVHSIQNISAVTEQSAASSEEVAASVEEQTAMAEEIARSADELKQLTAELAGKTASFKLNDR